MLRRVSLSVAIAAASLLYGAEAMAQDAAAGAVVFKRCAICHSTTGAISIGPALNGVVGRPSASLPKFTYSKAMTSKSIVWDKTTLDKFLTGPQAMVPGTKMAFAGLSNAKDRQDVIAYLATLKK